MNLSKIQLLFLLLLSPSLLRGQSLEIHTINVGQGDASLIIVRNVDSLKDRLTRKGISVSSIPTDMLDSAKSNHIILHGTVKEAVLVDFGVGPKQGDKVVRYLTQMGINPGDNLTAIVLTHNHQDHYGGFAALMASGRYKAPVYYRGVNPPFAGPAFKKIFLDICKKHSLILDSVDVTRSEIDLGTGLGLNKWPIKLTAVTSDGYVYKKNSTSIRVRANNQNDYGCSWILQYGAFRHFIGGDISGFSSGSYQDLESSLADSLAKYDQSIFTDSAGNAIGKGHICSFKVNHHGSQESSNPWFLYTLSPRVAFISCGAASKYDHPKRDVIKDFIGPLDISTWDASKVIPVPSSLKKWYLTSLSEKLGDIRDSIGHSTNKGIIAGNITLIVDDAKNDIGTSAFKVQWDGDLDLSMVTSDMSKVSLMRKPNAAGANFYECHDAKISDIKYFVH